MIPVVTNDNPSEAYILRRVAELEGDIFTLEGADETFQGEIEKLKRQNSHIFQEISNEFKKIFEQINTVNLNIQRVFNKQTKLRIAVAENRNLIIKQNRRIKALEEQGEITRNDARNNEQLRNEIEAFDPFKTTKRNISTINSDSEASFSECEKTVLAASSDSEDSKSEKFEKKNIKMALQPNQTVSLKDALRVVPEFDGHNIPFGEFLEGCNEAKEMIDSNAEGNLTKLIRSKITGEAKRAISNQQFNTIDLLTKYLKTIYLPAKTVTQLLGELGNEFQKENESVIAFANRMRDIGAKIFEAKKIECGTIDSTFKTSIESNLIDCFTRGLKTEIEQRMSEMSNINDTLKNAIEIERKLAAQKALRKGNQTDEIKFKRKIYACEICHKEGHATNNCSNKYNYCKFCQREGHTIDNCLKLRNQQNINIQCQLCNKNGHTALNCAQHQTCQICNQKGHTAKQCSTNRFTGHTITCQICNKSGHNANTCYSKNANSSLESRKQLKCQICDNIGHTTATCRNKICKYGQNKGHTIDECRKRQYNENLKTQQRSSNVIETNDLIAELMPL